MNTKIKINGNPLINNEKESISQYIMVGLCRTKVQKIVEKEKAPC